ncbi:DnaJ-domain-containing protein [Cucurbitaria berberidis CBS 394.84]|uniref:DnaJ-domain-containing protein n=1 Tax=Cucurbitaria berberidis CBS 394.84 TaxID=1168544 RepID=A0A9P4GEU7_9PLEO|nr:DnaJ-domain-containing protein [Cucurbitaria berberidis CBS 394.84]KAF1844154.1 DnaJ-domain-containing protein [Cucurbitaria berberidis CBS 394.84]
MPTQNDFQLLPSQSGADCMSICLQNIRSFLISTHLHQTIAAHMCEEPTKPEMPDYYFDLGLTQDATRSEIKKAFHNLALLHHPDKKAPGESVDAVEFRQAREAYEVLTDNDEKDTYDDDYVWVQSDWIRYRRKLKDWEQYLEEERLRIEAEEQARRQAAEEHDRRQAALEAERRRKEEAKKNRQDPEDCETRRSNFAEWAFRQAERLKKEAIKQEEVDRQQQEFEGMDRRRKAAEAQEKKAEEQRRKVKEWMRPKEAQKEEDRRRQRSAERDQRRQARGYGPRSHGGLCPCAQCVYDHWVEAYKQEVAEAKRLSEEAAQRAREEMERKAKEHLEKQAATEKNRQEREKNRQEREKKAHERKQAAKARAAETKTQATAQKQREEQEKKARLRMANEHIHKQQHAYLSTLAESGQEVGTTDVVIDIGWIKKKGVAECLFCGNRINYFSFHCPEGGIVLKGALWRAIRASCSSVNTRLQSKILRK